MYRVFDEKGHDDILFIGYIHTKNNTSYYDCVEKKEKSNIRKKIIKVYLGDNIEYNFSVDNTSQFINMVKEYNKTNGINEIEFKSIDEFKDNLKDIQNKLNKIDINKKANYLLVDFDNINININNTLYEDNKVNKIVLFDNFAVSKKLINNHFDLRDYKEYNVNFDRCINCKSNKGNFYIGNKNFVELCDSCINSIARSCAKIGGNEELAQKLTIKNI